MKAFLTTTAAAVAFSTASFAGTITFETDESGFVDVGGLNASNRTAEFDSTVGSITFNLTGDTFRVDPSDDPDGAGPAFDIDRNFENDIFFTQNNEGLGIDNNNPDSNPDIDGFGSLDLIRFTFSDFVRLDRIVFEDLGDNASTTDFVPTNFVFGDVTAPPGVQLFSVLDLPNDDSDGDEGFFDFGGLVVDEFWIGASGEYDSFRISRVEISAVPLPAAGWMLLAGVGGIAAMRRRSKKKS